MLCALNNSGNTEDIHIIVSTQFWQKLKLIISAYTIKSKAEVSVEAVWSVLMMLN